MKVLLYRRIFLDNLKEDLVNYLYQLKGFNRVVQQKISNCSVNKKSYLEHHNFFLDAWQKNIYSHKAQILVYLQKKFQKVALKIDIVGILKNRYMDNCLLGVIGELVYSAYKWKSRTYQPLSQKANFILWNPL